MEHDRAGVQVQASQTLEPWLFTINFIASRFQANSIAAPEGSFEGRISIPGIPTSQVRACCLLGLRWPSCYGHCSVARLQFHGWEPVLLCENSGRGVFWGTAMHSVSTFNVLLDQEPAECSKCLRIIHTVFLA